MSEVKPRQWFRARLRWAMLEEKWGLYRWREAEHIFLSEDRHTAFQEALSRTIRNHRFPVFAPASPRQRFLLLRMARRRGAGTPQNPCSPGTLFSGVGLEATACRSSKSSSFYQIRRQDIA